MSQRRLSMDTIRVGDFTAEISAPRGTDGLTDDQIVAALKAEVRAYSQWAGGEVWGYVVRGPDGEEIESLWGCYDLDDCRAEARRMAEACAADVLAAERLVAEHFAL